MKNITEKPDVFVQHQKGILFKNTLVFVLLLTAYMLISIYAIAG